MRFISGSPAIRNCILFGIMWREYSSGAETMVVVRAYFLCFRFRFCLVI
jgi:hypothetical protein